MNKITILGIEYTIKYVDGVIENGQNINGLCNYVDKEILVTTNNELVYYTIWVNSEGIV